MIQDRDGAAVARLQCAPIGPIPDSGESMSLGPTVKQVVTAWFMAGAFVALVARAQAPGGEAAAPNPNSAQSSIQVLMVNYYALGGAAKTEFEATALMSNAKGLAQLAITKEGSVSVKAQFSGLGSPTKFGNQFLTYILWAVTPKGQALQIGELSANGNGARVVASTVLRTFGMLVTAEPYSAVTRPSNIVVLTGKSMGEIQPPFALCELLRDGYAPPGYTYEPIDTHSGYASELVQALNARRIAQKARAEKYAEQSFRSAEGLYEYMVSLAIHEKKPSKNLLKVANSVTGSYEEARALAIRRQAP
jgi:hypothetical protein